MTQNQTNPLERKLRKTDVGGIELIDLAYDRDKNALMNLQVPHIGGKISCWPRND
jgi:hypothetical protein